LVLVSSLRIELYCNDRRSISLCEKSFWKSYNLLLTRMVLPGNIPKEDESKNRTLTKAIIMKK
jgi:hypothetical protein